ncbi:methyltransferase domain-containing protein [bacterium]|nr:methyltransferase domain-containing protein [bacterium]
MGYYDDKLHARRLERVYELATPAVERYLRGEIDFVRQHLQSDMTMVELGCGYGRVLPALAEGCRLVLGMDLAIANLRHGRSCLAAHPSIRLLAMDAAELAFPDHSLDAVVCIQNGLSAFAVDPVRLIQESLRVTRRGGVLLFSTYAEAFWEHRLEWFQLQAAEGLLGEIDWEATGGGEIVCRDGFRATTFTPDDFHRLTRGLDATVELHNVDDTSLFCVIRP